MVESYSALEMSALEETFSHVMREMLFEVWRTLQGYGKILDENGKRQNPKVGAIV